ncbi:unnamed protein product [Eruca vesicaria subsp. sativa]|uniref:Uncharacterized protein n=1 Tax=Eruca vesicaria subsp. sativa TaxID=29727 RepID=A0ABC8KL51_ERUVS|nr:unnamed protein product [Eruca vesicaria subsp. sativa]
MVIYSILLADLKIGRCSNTTEVQLPWFWEARNVRKGGELMSLHMLLIDKNAASQRKVSLQVERVRCNAQQPQFPDVGCPFLPLFQ